MSLILAIEPNKAQAQQLSALVRTQLKAELVTAPTAAAALTALGDRIPDVILTPALVSPRDEAALTGRLRELGNAASHVQTLAIPILASGSSRAAGGGLLPRKRDKGEDVGCDPAVFAEQLRIYLQRAAVERRAHASEAAARVAAVSTPPSGTVQPSADFNAFFVSADELDVSSLEIPDLIVSTPASAPGATPVAAPPRMDIPAARPPTSAPQANAAEPQPGPRDVEAALGPVTPPTAGPPLWRVTESIEDFYAAEGFDVRSDSPEVEVSLATLIDTVPPPSPASTAGATPAPAAPTAGRNAVPPAPRGAQPRPPRRAPHGDDWEYFDPSQSAFKALITRLDEIAGSAA